MLRLQIHPELKKNITSLDKSYSTSNCGALARTVVSFFTGDVELYNRSRETAVDIELYDEKNPHLASLIQHVDYPLHEIYIIGEASPDFAHAFAIEKINDGSTTNWRIYQAFSGSFNGNKWLEENSWPIESVQFEPPSFEMFRQFYHSSYVIGNLEEKYEARKREVIQQKKIYFHYQAMHEKYGKGKLLSQVELQCFLQEELAFASRRPFSIDRFPVRPEVTASIMQESTLSSDLQTEAASAGTLTDLTMVAESSSLTMR